MGSSSQHSSLLPQTCRLAQVLAGLSLATDLGHGQVEESAIRSCILAMRLIDTLALTGPVVEHTYYATLLRHIGCTAFAHEEALLFGGDEIDTRAAVELVDPSSPMDMLAFTIRDVGRTAPMATRATAVAKTLVQAPQFVKQLAASNCEVGNLMARRVGLPEAVQAALSQVYEYWNGRGQPQGLKGEDISVAARVSHVATHTMSLANAFDRESAVRTVAARAGGLLDPEIVDALVRLGQDAIPCEPADDAWEEVLSHEPAPFREIRPSQVDEIAAAFADFTDLKLTFTRGHSTGVADLADGAAQLAGMTAAERVELRRAALFHDIGRVAIPNGVWERAGPLGVTQWERVRLHPYHGERVLRRTTVLSAVANLVGMHHERQDGSGYFRQMTASSISPAGSILAAADAFQAMTQVRPHRPARSTQEAVSILRDEAQAGRLDPQAVELVLSSAGQSPARRQSWPGGLTTREVEVLRLIAGGASYKDVGRTLVISPRTAAHHVQHIYDKIGVATRAGAAMFAMEHRLLQPN